MGEESHQSCWFSILAGTGTEHLAALKNLNLNRSFSYFAVTPGRKCCAIKNGTDKRAMEVQSRTNYLLQHTGGMRRTGDSSRLIFKWESTAKHRTENIMNKSTV